MKRLFCFLTDDVGGKVDDLLRESIIGNNFVRNS